MLSESDYTDYTAQSEVAFNVGVGVLMSETCLCDSLQFISDLSESETQSTNASLV